MSDFTKYDLALREWERWGYVSDREDSPFLYYHPVLNEWRLDRYLIGEAELTEYTLGQYVLVEMPAGDVLGVIIGVKSEGVSGPTADGGDYYVGPRTPGFWIVLNDGQIDIYPGSVSRKPIMVKSNDE